MKLSEAINILLQSNSILQKVRALQILPYFKQAEYISSPQHALSLASQYAKHSHTYKINKKSIIYRPQQRPNSSYIVLSGTVKLFSCKTDEAISQLIKNQIYWRNPQSKKDQVLKLTQLNEDQISQQLIKQFFDDQDILLYNNFHIVKQGQYFGFTQMLQMARRPFMAFAIENVTLMSISKQIFDAFFKIYELHKQNYVINQLNKNIQKQQRQNANRLFKYLTPYTILKNCNFQQVLYRQGHLINAIYMIVNGQLQLDKIIQLQVPKNFADKDLRIFQKKRMDIKIAVALADQFVGQEDLVVNRRYRTYTLRCLVQNTLILKIQSGVFLRLLNQKYDCLKGISKKGKLKMETNQNNFKIIQKKVLKTFFKQFENLQDMIKDKMVQGIVGDQKLNKEGILQINQPQPGQYYRDTFQKAVIFGKKSNRSIKGVLMNLQNQKIINTPQKQSYQPDLQTQQKKLLKKSRRVNPGQIFQNYLSQQITKDQLNLRKTKLQQLMRKQQKKVSKIKAPQLKIQQQALKKAQIKLGKYKKSLSQQKHKINKAENRFQEHFQRIISDTITRKNKMPMQGQNNNMKQVIFQTYRDTIKNYRPYNTNTKDQMKILKAGNAQNIRRSMSSVQSRYPQKGYSPGSSLGYYRPIYNVVQKQVKQFDYIIGPSKNSKENEKGKLVNKIDLNLIESFPIVNNDKSNKIVVLNHMMKPIVYKS